MDHIARGDTGAGGDADLGARARRPRDREQRRRSRNEDEAEHDGDISDERGGIDHPKVPFALAAGSGRQPGVIAPQVAPVELSSAAAAPRFEVET
ncbi:hypothetical protein LB553_04395 [Mesorhizobium sp. CA8]|nr:hypothetical protein [Mesorhizobium sp. CA8]